MARELGINLGRLEDVNSVLSQALDEAISDLPDAIQGDLGPLLEAIRTATEGADANAAIQNLGDFILDLPGGLSKHLLPFLDLIGFQAMSPELGALVGIEQNTADTVAAIHALVGTIGGLPDLPIVKEPPSNIGLPPPPSSPMSVASAAPNGSVIVSQGELAEIKNVLIDIKEQNRTYQTADLRTSQEMESSLKLTAEQSRRISNA